MADMVKNINIVPFSDEYASAVEALVIEAWTPIRESYRRELGEELYGRIFGDWKRDKTESVLSMMISGRGYVAVIDGELAGFIHYEISEDGVSGEIGNNAVLSKYRGCGIAQAMYAFVFEKMKAKGVEYVSVVTGLDDGHEPARRSYEKAGFDRGLPSVKYYRKL